MAFFKLTFRKRSILEVSCCGAKENIFASTEDIVVPAVERHPGWSAKAQSPIKATLETAVKHGMDVNDSSSETQSQSTAPDDSSASLCDSTSEPGSLDSESLVADTLDTRAADPSTQSTQREYASRVRKAEWWSEATLDGVKDMQDAIQITQLIEARVVKHSSDSRAPAPWSSSQAEKFCEEMDLNCPGKSYVNVWLNVGESSLLFACEVLDKCRLESCLAKDPLGKRLKLVLNPVQVKLPFPAKGPQDADTIGCFFGSSASLQQTKTSSDVEVVTLQVDLFSKWMLKMALRNVGFRPGNVVEIIIVDWAGSQQTPAVLASCRLSVTDEYMSLIA